MSKRGPALLGILAAAIVGAACGGPERALVDQYFNALRAGDNLTLTSFAMTAFDRKVDSWKVTAVGEETRSPVVLPDLAQKVAELEAELAANKRAASAYSLERYADIDRARELQKANRPVPASLKPVADKWTEFNDKDRELKRKVAAAKEAVEREKRNVTLSVGQVEEVEKLGGEMVQKQLDLALTIEGQVEHHVMTLRKYELTGAAGPRMVSRWVVESIEPKG